MLRLRTSDIVEGEGGNNVGRPFRLKNRRAPHAHGDGYGEGEAVTCDEERRPSEGDWQNESGGADVKNRTTTRDSPAKSDKRDDSDLELLPLRESHVCPALHRGYHRGNIFDGFRDGARPIWKDVVHRNRELGNGLLVLVRGDVKPDEECPDLEGLAIGVAELQDV